MISLFKRFISAVIAAICLFAVNVCAESVITVNPGDEFYVYGRQNAEIAEISGISENELSDYCFKNNIEYLAVNKDNSKQIRVSVKNNDFTNSVINISGLSDDSISSLLPQIIGIEGVRGEIINRNGQKFIKTELRSADNGGDYILTEFITVADKKSYVLSFYTDAKKDTGYTDAVFETYIAKVFINEKNEAQNGFVFIVPVLTVIFVLAFLFVLITVIIDFRKKQ